MKKNDFEIMCDKLEKEVMYSKVNPIEHVKQYLADYIGDDFDMLLRIKAEASEIQFHTFITLCVGLTALAVSGFSLMRSIIKDNIIDLIILVLFLVLLCFLYKGFIVNANVRKWQQYIVVSINDMELEYRNTKKSSVK